MQLGIKLLQSTLFSLLCTQQKTPMDSWRLYSGKFPCNGVDRPEIPRLVSRVDAGQAGVSLTLAWLMQGRPLCNAAQCTASEVHELEAISICGSGICSWREATLSVCMVGRCLRKLNAEKATILLMLPVWLHQTWYPILLETLVESPILLQSTLSMDPSWTPHPGNQPSHLESVRQRFISQQATQLITAAWSNATYQSSWGR